MGSAKLYYVQRPKIAPKRSLGTGWEQRNDLAPRKASVEISQSAPRRYKSVLRWKLWKSDHVVQVFYAIGFVSGPDLGGGLDRVWLIEALGRDVGQAGQEVCFKK